uniref:Uncharacterized protein n=1 Tax=Anguilla anguilla TaxID=7936 RepID=A0A0E9V0J3_ANGAN
MEVTKTWHFTHWTIQGYKLLKELKILFFPPYSCARRIHGSLA